jgi:crotonobetainyl-CoA:carnitine CoA-transferase CaiB-like acyl-CoA transferase
MMEVLETGRDAPKTANGSRHHAPQGCYPCVGDDRWCVLGAANDGEWRRLCAAIGRDDWLADMRFATAAERALRAAEIDAGIAAFTRERAPEDVMRVLQAAGLAAAAVHDVVDQSERDPQLAARRFFEEIPHLKQGTVVATGIPLGLAETPGRTTRSGAAIGEDNEAVFRELIGLTAAAYRAAIAAGAIETPPD